jgi:hypothetical protein
MERSFDASVPPSAARGLSAHSTARRPHLRARAPQRSGASKQRRLRRPPRPERGRRHRVLAPLPPMRENAFDELRLLNTRDHLQPPTAAGTPRYFQDPIVKYAA